MLILSKLLDELSCVFGIPGLPSTLHFDDRKFIIFTCLYSIDFIEQLNCCKLLGVFFQANLKGDSHVDYFLSQCSQRIYLLKLLRHQAMPSDQLSTVAQAIVVSRILYALPAWGGFLSVELRNRIDGFLGT